jgi:three-Cys-motif partner protein
LPPRPPEEWLRKEVRELLSITAGWSDPGSEAFETKPWTWIKLAVLHSYLPYYLAILRPRYRRLVFVDLFAGSGVGRYVRASGPALCSPGSSVVAASFRTVEPYKSRRHFFDRILSIDTNQSRLGILEEALASLGHATGPTFRAIHGDCNGRVADVIASMAPYGTHALVFADPEGLDLYYGTLKAILDAHDATDLFVTHLVAGGARAHAVDESEKMDRFYGGPEWHQFSTRAEFSQLYARRLRELRDYVDVLSVKEEIGGYSYDLLFGVRETSTHSEWRSVVSALRPKLEHLTGRDVKRVIETEVPRAILGRQTHQSTLDVAGEEFDAPAH